jgi:hypothetical protein
MGEERLRLIDKMRVMNAYCRKISRQIHAEKRLKERFDLDYSKVKKVLENSGFKILLDDGRDKVCYLSYLDNNIYFVLFHNEIKTFLTEEMVKKTYPDVFNPPKKAKKKKKKKQKRKRSKLIPASELFK